MIVPFGMDLEFDQISSDADFVLTEQTSQKRTVTARSSHPLHGFGRRKQRPSRERPSMLSAAFWLGIEHPELSCLAESIQQTPHRGNRKSPDPNMSNPTHVQALNKSHLLKTKALSYPRQSQLSNSQFRELSLGQGVEATEQLLASASQRWNTPDELISAMSASVLLEAAISSAHGPSARQWRRDRSALAWGAQIQVIRRRPRNYN